MSHVPSLRSAVVPTRSSRPYVRQHKYRKVSVDAFIDEGMRMEVHMQQRYGTEATADFIQQAAGANCGRILPYGFYPAYCDEVLEVKFTKAKRESLRRSLVLYAKRKAIGGARAFCFWRQRQERPTAMAVPYLR